MITFCKLYYGDGNVRVDYNYKIGIIEIFYTGKIEIVNKLNTNLAFIVNDKKITIRTKRLDNPSISDLFSYQGMFKINKCYATDIDWNKIVSARINNNLAYWYTTNTKWESGGIWDNYLQTNIVGKKVQKTKLVKSIDDIPILEKPTPPEE